MFHYCVIQSSQWCPTKGTRTCFFCWYFYNFVSPSLNRPEILSCLALRVRPFRFRDWLEIGHVTSTVTRATTTVVSLFRSIKFHMLPGQQWWVWVPVFNLVTKDTTLFWFTTPIPRPQFSKPKPTWIEIEQGSQCDRKIAFHSNCSWRQEWKDLKAPFAMWIASCVYACTREMLEEQETTLDITITKLYNLWVLSKH